MAALYTYLLLLWQPVFSSDLCQDGGGTCVPIGDVEAALRKDVSEETLKLLQTKQATCQGKLVVGSLKNRQEVRDE